MSRPTYKMATCHPNRGDHFRGLCRQCYREKRDERPQPDGTILYACNRCGRVQDATQFSSKRTSGGLVRSSKCKTCIRQFGQVRVEDMVMEGRQLPSWVTNGFSREMKRRLAALPSGTRR
jgi:hypothetical protein